MQTEQVSRPPAILFDSKTGESRQECFKRHYARCIMKIGDRVVFKKPKRQRVYGRINYIETDVSRMYWSQGDKNPQPRYIRVEVEIVNKATGEISIEYVWTCESKIQLSFIGGN